MTPPSNRQPSQRSSATRYQPEQGPQWRFPDMPGEAAQQPQQYPQYPLRFPDMPAPGSTARARRSGLQTGGWITVIVATAMIVGIVVWLGLNASKVPTGTVEEREALSEVQTPDDDAPAPANENNVLVPAFAPWAPGTKIQTTDHRPAPGEHFTAQSCTAAFSFTGKDGRAYAVTAGHCGREGDLVWPTNASTAFDYASEVGHFIFSGLYSQNTPETEGADVGIIEITDPERFMDVVGAPIPTGIGEGLGPVDRVCKTGATTGYTCGDFEDTERVQIVNLDPGVEDETFGDIAAVCAASGDSGGPVFADVGGRATIIGVVSGTEAGRAGEECYEGMEDPHLMSYSNVKQVMAVIRHAVPDAEFIPRRW
ncbi:S1 family peptidase [Corynebacterium haemomassiliense]|uniref:S1 family peptidase n=1 Tax=Corynebacterium haemomassiliense TaxID=2754726 RepID=UPI00288A2954|nr:S1 family peptidase [Corynebacterium haemomassiliense]